MKSYKLNIRFMICLLFLFAFLILVAKAIPMLFLGKVSYGNGERIGRFISIIMTLMLLIPISTYLYSFIVMLKQYILHKRNAFVLTERGIENTFTMIVILCFWFVLPIKEIPWESVIWLDDNGFCSIRVNTKLIKSGMFTKLIIKILGYNFCYKFTTQKITTEEIMRYYQPSQYTSWKS